MKLLIDENLSPRLAALLSEADHDASHVRDLDAAGASDAQLIDLTLADGRTIVSADTDFGALLAATTTAPSVILVREVVDLHPQESRNSCSRASSSSRRSSPPGRWSP